MAKQKPGKKKTAATEDRHGFRRLTEQDDLFHLFGETDSPAASKISFTSVVEDSLSEESIRNALRDKNITGLPRTSDEGGRPQPAACHPQDTIDLHGLTAREAETRTESFILTASRRGLKALRIITGKGLHSDGLAVLQEVVENKLEQLRQSGLVVDSRWEKGARNRSGAIIVRLK